MATTKQREAARENIKKAQAKRQGRGRAKPGTKGGGEYYRVIVRPKTVFTSFRTQDVGDPGGLLRVAGHRSSGSWATQAWLIGKDMAHVKDGKLIADHEDAQYLLDKLGSEPVHDKGDIFHAKDRPNVAEKDKPTAAQQKARKQNIKKAQATRRSH